jgi:hypothetical protein
VLGEGHLNRFISTSITSDMSLIAMVGLIVANVRALLE